jgi:hypothetical protein
MNQTGCSFIMTPPAECMFPFYHKSTKISPLFFTEIKSCGFMGLTLL